MSLLESPVAPACLRPSGDRYRILGKVGEGSCAVVYRALDVEIGEVIALKVLSARVAGDPGVMARLKQEIRLARRIRHPAVARLYDLEQWDERLCITMELIAGRTLEQELGGGAFPPAEVIRILATLARALEAAHDLCVVHRDLKPANVVLDEARRPYVLDFGIALGPGASDGQGVIRGTPTYMAPERWRGDPGGPSSDLYSLGVLGYEMLAGRPPFTGGSLRVLMSQHLHSPPPALDAVADLPRGLEALLRRLLEKRPGARPATAGEAARELLRLAPPRLSAPRLRGKVLVVEDEPAIRGLLARLLADRGVAVVVAADGLEGVRVAASESPDLVLLDISMPGPDGVATLRALQAIPALATRPVVMLSGSDNPDHPGLLRGMGAAAFLNKPVNADVLDLILEKYLA